MSNSKRPVVDLRPAKRSPGMTENVKKKLSKPIFNATSAREGVSMISIGNMIRIEQEI
jgi:hypothetical protein